MNTFKKVFRPKPTTNDNVALPSDKEKRRRRFSFLTKSPSTFDTSARSASQSCSLIDEQPAGKPPFISTTFLNNFSQNGTPRSRSFFGPRSAQSSHTFSTQSSESTTPTTSRGSFAYADSGHSAAFSLPTAPAAAATISISDSRSMLSIDDGDSLLKPAESSIRSHGKSHASTASQTHGVKLVDQDQYLQLGMQYHERGELEKATHYWRLSAENESPLGLFFFGIALRHGWGCKKNPAIAVRHLQKAAECAVFDLQTGIAKSVMVARSELVLAIYELGVCFRHGWGVPKNFSTAAYYFQIAANLGDPDAQNDLAFCYMHGHGVKKDIHKAAKYYRMADQQGQGLVGNSWIWKSKYDLVDDYDPNRSSTSLPSKASINSTK